MYTKEDRIRKEIKIYKNTKAIGHIYLCKNCNREIWVSDGRMKSSKGLCFDCSRFRPQIQTEGTKECMSCKKELDISNFCMHRGKNTFVNKCLRCLNLAKYGITSADYDLMLQKQNSKCLICNQEEEKIALAVDHCHITSKIRGLLCGKCNRALGLFNDDIELLTNAINYLKTE